MLRFQSERDSNDCALRGSSHVAAKDPDKWRTLVRESISKAFTSFTLIVTLLVFDSQRALAAMCRARGERHWVSWSPRQLYCC